MVIVDTDVIISSIRNNEIAKQLIRKYMPFINISIIIEMELYAGANNKSKKEIVLNIVKQHEVIQINKSICDIALRLIKTYNTGSRSLFLSDAIIAATCLNNKCPLVTFNTKDYSFIKGLQLAK